MKSLQRLVVMALLGVWCFPAVSFAEPLSTASAEVNSRTSSDAASERPSSQTEESTLAAREKASQGLQDFRGGGVYIYMGGGAALVVLIILLLILV